MLLYTLCKFYLYKFHYHESQMLKSIAKILVFVSSFFVFNPLMAENVATLYDVDILVADESVETRDLTFDQGLDEIFI